MSTIELKIAKSKNKKGYTVQTFVNGKHRPKKDCHTFDAESAYAARLRMVREHLESQLTQAILNTSITFKSKNF